MDRHLTVALASGGVVKKWEHNLAMMYHTHTHRHGTPKLCRHKKSRQCNKARASIRPITLNIWLTATWILLWSAVYQKNCHLVCRNPHIRAAPCSSEKFIPKHINNKGMRKLSKYCSRIAANFAPQKIFLSIHPSPGPVSSACLSSPLPSLSPRSFSWPNLLYFVLCRWWSLHGFVPTIPVQNLEFHNWKSALSAPYAAASRN